MGKKKNKHRPTPKKNYIEELNKYAQRTHSELKYEDVPSEAPQHTPTFVKKVMLNGRDILSVGRGKSEEQARENAAKSAMRWINEKENRKPLAEDHAAKTPAPSGPQRLLSDTYCTGGPGQENKVRPRQQTLCRRSLTGLLESVHQDPVDDTENAAAAASTESGPQMSTRNIDYVSQLNQNGLILRPEEKIIPGLNNATDCSSVTVGDEEYPASTGATKSAAKEEAARLGDDILCGSGTNKTADDKLENNEELNGNVFEACNKMGGLSVMDQATTSTPSESSRFDSEYDSVELLGIGGFGRVLKAKHKLSGIFNAIKIVSYKEKCLREVKALSKLHHNNIVAYRTCWVEDSGRKWDDSSDSCSTTESSTGEPPGKFLYIQMELCDTKTLRVWIDEMNVQNVKKSLRNSKRREDSLSIATQIVSGVEYIHSKMLIHRDLKPGNIMYGQDGGVKIVDFGLVADENDDDAENLIERTGFKGTPSYMAPEQRSQKTYDQKVDIYAFGLIFFELLWELCSVHERQKVWNAIREQNFPPGFSNDFLQEFLIIKPALCMKPEDRPKASQLKKELEESARRLETQKTVQGTSRSV